MAFSDIDTKLLFGARQMFSAEVQIGMQQSQPEQNSRKTSESRCHRHVIGQLFKPESEMLSKDDELTLRVGIEKQPRHKTQVHIEYHLRTKRIFHKTEYYRSDVLSLQFNSINVDKFECVAVTKENLADIIVKHQMTSDEHMEMQTALDTSGHIFEFTITMKPDGVLLARNFFTYVNDYGKHSATVQHLRTYWSTRNSKKAHFLVRGRTFNAELQVALGQMTTQEERDAWSDFYIDGSSGSIFDERCVEKMDKRPIYRLAPQHTFQSFSEFVTVMGIGAIEEHEYEIRLGKVINNVPIYLTPIPKSSNTFFAIVKLEAMDKYALTPGMKGVIEWTGEQQQDEATSDTERTIEKHRPRNNKSLAKLDMEGTFRIVNHLAFRKEGDKAMIIHREVTNYDPRTPAQPKPFIDLYKHSFSAVAEAMKNDKSETCSLFLNISETGKNTRLKILADLGHQHAHGTSKINRLLRANDHTQYKRLDWFSTIKDQPRASAVIDKYTYDFDAGQKRALKLARKAPLGLTVVHGVPGSGKTHLSVGMILPLLALTQDTQQSHHILMLAPTNSSVDAFALKMTESASLHLPERLNIIVRIHSHETKTIAMGKMLQEEAGLEPSEQLLSRQMVQLLNDYEAYRQSNDITLDPRCKMEELSTTMWMLRFAGVIPHAVSQNTNWKSFREHLCRLQKGLLGGSSNISAYQADLRRLWETVIQSADVIVTTPVTAMKSRVTSILHDKITHVVMDEAGRVAEHDTLQLFTVWIKAAKLIIGDPQQIGPFSHSHNFGAAHFGGNMRLSFLARMIDTGFETAMLTKNYRSPQDHVSLFGDTFYDGRLTHDDGTDSRPLAAKFRQWLSKFVIKPTGERLDHIMLLDTSNSIQSTSMTGSQINKIQAETALGIVKMLLKEGFESKDIVILTFYDGQYWHIKQRQSERILSDMDLKPVHVDKVDSYMGQESEIVILDTTVSHRIGFLDETSRLIVGLSRARCGMIIIANVSGIRNERSFKDTWLQILILKLAGSHQVRVSAEMLLPRSTVLDPAANRA